MSKRNRRALSLFAIFYIGFGFFLFLNQERIVYRPFPQDFGSCPALASAEQVNASGTRMYVNQDSAPVIVLYHGNAGSACDRAWYAMQIEAAGYGYAIVEYAGYSNDPRQTTHDLIKQDVRNVIAYFTETNHPVVGIIGESIGSGPASYHASIAPPAQLLLITPFTSLKDVAQDRFWFYPAGLLVDNAFDTVAKLAAYEGTVTIIHGTDDTVIPFRFGQAVYNSIATEKTLIAVDGADHNNLLGYPETQAAITQFLY
jgi:pimeloyl-ACP methyl ester carboxylesterase